MSLASNYAQVLKDGGNEKKVVAHMKRRGHLSLLPTVVRILERSSVGGDTVTVAKESDAHRVKKDFPGARIIVDPKVVGGHLAKRGSTIVDATYRTALVTLYKNVTR